jgi:hypothetical protein
VCGAGQEECTCSNIIIEHVAPIDRRLGSGGRSPVVLVIMLGPGFDDSRGPSGGQPESPYWYNLRHDILDVVLDYEDLV